MHWILCWEQRGQLCFHQGCSFASVFKFVFRFPVLHSFDVPWILSAALLLRVHCGDGPMCSESWRVELFFTIVRTWHFPNLRSDRVWDLIFEFQLEKGASAEQFCVILILKICWISEEILNMRNREVCSVWKSFLCKGSPCVLHRTDRVRSSRDVRRCVGVLVTAHVFTRHRPGLLFCYWYLACF